MSILRRVFGAASVDTGERLIVSFKNPELGLSRLLTRCDSALGGFSTADLSTIEDAEAGTVGRFSGNLSLDLPPERPDIVRLGFAMFRTKDVQPRMLGLIGSEFMDWTGFDCVALRVRGDRRKYHVNIQAESPFPTDLYQHRLFLRTPGEWETVYVPFKNFILTNGGEIQPQTPLSVAQVRSIGIGLIDRQYGPYTLDVDWIKILAGVPAAAEASAGSAEDRVDVDGSSTGASSKSKSGPESEPTA